MSTLKNWEISYKNLNFYFFWNKREQSGGLGSALLIGRNRMKLSSSCLFHWASHSPVCPSLPAACCLLDLEKRVGCYSAPCGFLTPPHHHSCLAPKGFEFLIARVWWQEGPRDLFIPSPCPSPTLFSKAILAAFPHFPGFRLPSGSGLWEAALEGREGGEERSQGILCPWTWGIRHAPLWLQLLPGSSLPSPLASGLQ